MKCAVSLLKLTFFWVSSQCLALCAFHGLKITITRWIVRYLQVYDLVWATPRAMLGGQPGRRGRVCGCVRSISSTVRVCPPSVARSAGISLVFANGCRGPAARPGVSPAPRRRTKCRATRWQSPVPWAGGLLCVDTSHTHGGLRPFE